MCNRVRLSRGVSAIALSVAVLLGSVGASRVAAQGTQTPPKTAPARPSATGQDKAAPKAQPQAKSDLPAARTIIDRHIQAIGGRKAILGHQSTRITGTVTVSGNGMTGNFEIFAAKSDKGDDKALSKVTLGGIGDLVEAYDGTHAWSSSPMTGPMLSQGKELEQRKYDADFYGELHDPARYTSITTVEKTTFQGRPCYKISLVRKDGAEDFDFYDVETGLKAGTIATRESPMGSVTSTVWQGDYKKFGDVLQPTTIKQTNTGVELVMKVSTVEYDTVPASTFEAPQAIKALIK
jgi:hypothetical protein